MTAMRHLEAEYPLEPGAYANYPGPLIRSEYARDKIIPQQFARYRDDLEVVASSADALPPVTESAPVHTEDTHVLEPMDKWDTVRVFVPQDMEGRERRRRPRHRGRALVGALAIAAGRG